VVFKDMSWERISVYVVSVVGFVILSPKSRSRVCAATLRKHFVVAVKTQKSKVYVADRS